MLKGLRIRNGVTQNEKPSGTPVFVHRQLAENVSDFATLFVPLLEGYEFRWALFNQPDMWSLPGEWMDELEEGQDEDTPGTSLFEFYNSGYETRSPEDGKAPVGYEYGGKVHRTYEFAAVYRHDFVKKYSRYIRDDWNELIALTPDSDSAEKLLELLSRDYYDTVSIDEYRSFVARNAQWYFYNFDGLWWQFHARDEAHLDMVRSHLAGFPSVTVEELSKLDLTVKNEYLPAAPVSPETQAKAEKVADQFEQQILGTLSSLFEEEQDDDQGGSEGPVDDA
ncbi:MAG: hypothetical protein GF331_16830 [Chitinivibrionales bacterium]|nr:hypothetical protein [Chitinivibrionales bacterium]